MRRLASMTILLLTVILFGCSDKGIELLSTIENSSWSLQRIEISGSQMVVIPSSESYTLEFRTSTDVGGVSHCNTYEAKYTLPSGGSISFRDIVSTEIACRPPTHDGEFQLALSEARSVQLLGDELRLSNSDGTRVLYFVRNQ